MVEKDEIKDERVVCPLPCWASGTMAERALVKEPPEVEGQRNPEKAEEVVLEKREVRDFCLRILEYTTMCTDRAGEAVDDRDPTDSVGRTEETGVVQELQEFHIREVEEEVRKEQAIPINLEATAAAASCLSN